jgi:hypothetical protein
MLIVQPSLFSLVPTELLSRRKDVPDYTSMIAGDRLSSPGPALGETITVH